MKSIEDICDFVKKIEYYIQSEYHEKWFIRFKDYRNSVHIDYHLTDSFMSDRTIQYAAGVAIDILRMKYND